MNSEEEEAAVDEGWSLPPDMFLEILRRLPPISWRRLRLVCRLWRDAVDTRTTEMQRHVKPTPVFHICPCTYAVDGSISEGRRCRKLWTSSTARIYRDVVRMVGTCNGLLCVCDGSNHGITVANPLTGDTLAVPPLPGFRHTAEMYCFLYHRTRGQYKILHLSSLSGGQPDALQIFTLGEASWRSVPAAGVACSRENGLVGIDSKAYWIDRWMTGSTQQVMAFDLDGERIGHIGPSPVPVGSDDHLTEVHGRLAIAATVRSARPKIIQVWVLDDGSWSWSCCYTVKVHGLAAALTRPRFIHGDYILTQEQSVVYANKLSDVRLQSGVLRIKRRRGRVLAGIENGWGELRTFSYVETTEQVGDELMAPTN